MIIIILNFWEGFPLSVDSAGQKRSVERKRGESVLVVAMVTPYSTPEQPFLEPEDFQAHLVMISSLVETGNPPTCYLLTCWKVIALEFVSQLEIIYATGGYDHSLP